MAHLVFLTSTPSTVSEGSGTWVGISVLRDAIMALGHEVTLLSGSSTASGHALLARILFNLRARFRVRRIKADVLVGFDLDGVFLSKGASFHVAAIKGVLADEATHERGAKRIELEILARLEARHVRRCDRVITTSVYSSERIARFYGVTSEKIFVVPELIDLNSWRRGLAEAVLIDGPPRILCVAHLYPRKGIDTLLRAFVPLQERAILRVVGVGPERDRLEHLARDLAIADRVHFLGYLPLSALAAEYRNATIFALPSAQEGFGIVFLEAMASSLPVVAGRAAAIPEVVTEGVTALLVDPQDEAALTRSLERLLDNPAERHAMGSAGLLQVQQYDAPIVAQTFLRAVMNSLIAVDGCFQIR
jgi:glycosyltransferase involved in cell wall biosynthesis